MIKKNSVPLYLQLKNTIKKEIRTGILKPGEQIPSESQFQNKYNMSRVTVRNAMKELENEGYIIKVQGKGSFVAQSDMLRLPIGVTSLSDDAKMQGIEIKSVIIEAKLKKVESKMDKEFFGICDDDNIISIKRIRYANGIPLLIEENHFSEKMKDLIKEDLTCSLYDTLINKFHMIPSNKGRRSIKIILASEDIAKYFQIPVGTSVIESEMCVYDMNGEPIHTVKDIVRGDNDQFMKWYV